MSITIVGSLRLQAVSIIRPSLDPVNANKLVGIILMTEHFTRTISPIVGGLLADKYHKFKLIGIITYIFGEYRDILTRVRWKSKSLLTWYSVGIAGTAVYLYSIWIKKTEWLIFGAAVFGFFTSIGWTVILNFGGEIIYPEPESTGTTMSMMITSFLTSLMSYAIRRVSHEQMLYKICIILYKLYNIWIWWNLKRNIYMKAEMVGISIFLMSVSFIGLGLLTLSKETLNRQSAESDKNVKTDSISILNKMDES